MIESGMAKAVLDIFRDYCTQMCESRAVLTNEDQVMVVVAQALIDILKSDVVRFCIVIQRFCKLEINCTSK